MKRIIFLVLALLALSVGCIYVSGPGDTGGSNQTPVINSFNANPASISDGDSSTLSWSVSGATSVTIDHGIGSVALSGTRTVSPDADTVYTLTATNSSGSASATTDVVVSGSATPSGAPVINSFSASPDSIPAGGTSILSWNVSGATTISIDPAIGTVNAAGTQAVSPASTTTFTLTATNSSGNVVQTAQVVVAGVTPSGIPAINSFIADPAEILIGGTSTLSWDVSGATNIAIDQGIGAVAAAGTMTVTPAATTVYTLTAINPSGMATRSITLTADVILMPPPLFLLKPDLIITGIAKMEVPAGYIIKYSIKNQGTGAAAASYCKIYANGDVKGSDNVPVLAAGSTYTGSFSGWIYNPTAPMITVVADVGGSVNESDESNNQKQVSIAVENVYDFVTRASSSGVVWQSGAGVLAFPGATNDPKGFAAYRTNITLEDNHIYSQVLETHPQWVDDGMIQGYYTEMFNTLNYKVRAGEHFYATIGFLKNASAGNARFRVMIRPEGGTSNWIYDSAKPYNGSLRTIDVDLTPYAGSRADFILKVEANGSSSQDWAAWAEAKVIR